jgi:sugar lactone lactonase YvrE
MKKIIIPSIIVVVLIIVYFWVLPSFAGNRLLDKPESVAYDAANGRFLISNVGSGSIVAMDEDGNFSKFMSKDFEAPKGIIAKGDLLYVTDPTAIHIVSISAAQIMETHPIKDSQGLNDIALGEDGKLYITDMQGSAVFIYDPSTKNLERIVSPLLQSPNGIVYDRPRRQMFIVNNSEHSPVLSLNVEDNSVSIFMDTIYSNLDGITIDDLGRIYFSSWAEEMIIQIPQEQNRFITDLTGYKGAADIYYHLPTNELIVPMLTKNKIERISLNK